MGFPVSSLLENKSDPVVVQLMDPIAQALKTMLENDFSQLPVVDDNQKPVGLLTYSAIVKTLRYLGSTLDELRVDDAYEKIDKTYVYSKDDDLFTMLDRLLDTNVVLVVDGQEQLVGIVTSYDTNDYFRKRAEDMMHVEDIEGTIQDLVIQAFTTSDGEIEEDRLQAAIKTVSLARQISKADFNKALKHYLQLAGQEKSNPAWAEQSYEVEILSSIKIPQFSELTLNDYIEILLHPKQETFFESVFSHPKKNIRKLFEGVRDTRNSLAHFREIDSDERDRLHYCKNLLERVMDRLQVDSVSPSNGVHLQAEGVVTGRPELGKPELSQILPLEEEPSSSESKYAPLMVALELKAGEQSQVRLTFDEIDSILGGGLPLSARKYREWWANDSVGHVQSQVWLEAGWRTASINMTEGVVVFNRIQDLEKRYIDFFSALLKRQSKTSVPLKKNLSAQGTSWIAINQVPDPGPAAAIFAFSFSTQRRFRVELYIDSGDREQNKKIFDLLYAQRDRFQEQTGQELSWERIDKKRASRVAVYHSGHIQNPENQLKQLREWAAETMVNFYSALVEPTLAAVQEVVKH